MIKNRVVQIIFQTTFCILGVACVAISLGLFDYNYHSNFFLHFTNLSNYLCIGIMCAELIQTVKKKNDSYVSVAIAFKFISMLSILLTLIVFNFVLAPRENYPNYSVISILFHIILLIMFTLDWFLFYERNQVKWYYPLLALIFPFIYIVIIYIRAWVLNFDNSFYIYPYFFLDLNNQGILGVLKWVISLLIGYVSLGFILFKFDHHLTLKIKKR